jgi:hypothetical protein
LLAATQAQLIDGIHLPDIVRLPSTLMVAGRTSAHRSRGQRGLAKPALQGSFAGTGFDSLLQEQNANEAAAPGRMLAALSKPTHQMVHRAL